MASQPQVAGWLAENGPKELERLFRAIVFHPSAPLLLADNDRHNLEASVGASKLLGLPREKIIGRSLDDFAEPSFKPVISERWRCLSEGRRARGNAQAGGCGRTSTGSRVLRQRERAAGAQSFGAARQDRQRRRARGDGQRALKSRVPAWVQDYALFLLDVGRKDCRLVRGSGTHLRLQERRGHRPARVAALSRRRYPPRASWMKN